MLEEAQYEDPRETKHVIFVGKFEEVCVLVIFNIACGLECSEEYTVPESI